MVGIKAEAGRIELDIARARLIEDDLASRVRFMVILQYVIRVK